MTSLTHSPSSPMQTSTHTASTAKPTSNNTSTDIPVDPILWNAGLELTAVWERCEDAGTSRVNFAWMKELGMAIERFDRATSTFLSKSSSSSLNQVQLQGSSSSSSSSASSSSSSSTPSPVRSPTSHSSVVFPATIQHVMRVKEDAERYILPYLKAGDQNYDWCCRKWRAHAKSLKPVQPGPVAFSSPNSNMATMYGDDSPIPVPDAEVEDEEYRYLPFAAAQLGSNTIFTPLDAYGDGDAESRASSPDLGSFEETATKPLSITKSSSPSSPTQSQPSKPLERCDECIKRDVACVRRPERPAGACLTCYSHNRKCSLLIGTDVKMVADEKGKQVVGRGQQRKTVDKSLGKEEKEQMQNGEGKEKEENEERENEKRLEKQNPPCSECIKNGLECQRRPERPAGACQGCYSRNRKCSLIETSHPNKRKPSVDLQETLSSHKVKRTRIDDGTSASTSAKVKSDPVGSSQTKDSHKKMMMARKVQKGTICTRCLRYNLECVRDGRNGENSACKGCRMKRRKCELPKQRGRSGATSSVPTQSRSAVVGPESLQNSKNPNRGSATPRLAVFVEIPSPRPRDQGSSRYFSPNWSSLPIPKSPVSDGSSSTSSVPGSPSNSTTIPAPAPASAMKCQLCIETGKDCIQSLPGWPCDTCAERRKGCVFPKSSAPSKTSKITPKPKPKELPAIKREKEAELPEGRREHGDESRGSGPSIKGRRVSEKRKREAESQEERQERGLKKRRTMDSSHSSRPALLSAVSARGKGKGKDKAKGKSGGLYCVVDSAECIQNQKWRRGRCQACRKLAASLRQVNTTRSDATGSNTAGPSVTATSASHLSSVSSKTTKPKIPRSKLSSKPKSVGKGKSQRCGRCEELDLECVPAENLMFATGICRECRDHRRRCTLKMATRVIASENPKPVSRPLASSVVSTKSMKKGSKAGSVSAPVVTPRPTGQKNSIRDTPASRTKAKSVKLIVPTTTTTKPKSKSKSTAATATSTASISEKPVPSKPRDSNSKRCERCDELDLECVPATSMSVSTGVCANCRDHRRKCSFSQWRVKDGHRRFSNVPASAPAPASASASISAN